MDSNEIIVTRIEHATVSARLDAVIDCGPNERDARKTEARSEYFAPVVGAVAVAVVIAFAPESVAGELATVAAVIGAAPVVRVVINLWRR